MTQEQAQICWKNHLDSIKNDTEPIMQLHEWHDYYKKQADELKKKKSGEARKRKAKRKGIQPFGRKDLIPKEPIAAFDELTEHKARSIKRLYDQGKTMEQICDIVGISYVHVENVLFENDWSHI